MLLRESATSDSMCARITSNTCSQNTLSSPSKQRSSNRLVSAISHSTTHLISTTYPGRAVIQDASYLLSRLKITLDTTSFASKLETLTIRRFNCKTIRPFYAMSSINSIHSSVVDQHEFEARCPQYHKKRMSKGEKPEESLEKHLEVLRSPSTVTLTLSH